MLLGAELAVSEINERGGVRGRRLELLALDDRGHAATAVQIARRFVGDNSVMAVVGHAQSNTTIAAAQVYDFGPDPMAVVSPSASSVEIGRSGNKVFRVCPDDVAHATAMAEWALTGLGTRRAVILYHNDRDSRTIAAAFREAFLDGGGDILAEDPFSLALPSFEPYLTRALRRGRVEALLVAGGGSSIGSILAALDSVGSNPTVLGRIDLLQHAQDAGYELEGAALSASYLPYRNRRAERAFQTGYMQARGGQRPNHVAAGSYDIVQLIATAVERQGATRSGIRAYLSGVGTEMPPYEGVTGSIGFDDYGNLQRSSVEIGVVRNGVVTPTSVR